MMSKEETILKTATTLFSQYGYHSVGVDRIIGQSNVAKMTFYKYFPSKEALIERSLEYRDETLREAITQAMSSARTAQGKLKALFDWYSQWFASADFNGCMFIKASEEFPDSNSPAKHASAKHKNWLTKLIQELLIEMKSKSPEKLAPLIMALLDGLTVSSNLNNLSATNQVSDAWKFVKILIQPKT